MKALLLKLLDHLRYPSTYQGLVAFAAVVGLNLAPELATQITSTGVAVAGLIAFFFSDSDVKSK